MMEVLTPVDVNSSSSGLFSTSFQSMKFIINVCMELFLEVLFKVQHSLPQLNRAHKLMGGKKIEIWLLGL